uniref:Uncharacterized protein n=1 Tax=Ditylenchus dipsaci TaxID=166011 RepID=A0A915ELB3_9BILA
MSENIGINGVVSDVENEPKKIDMLDFVISSYDDFVHPERKKTSVDAGIHIKSSTTPVDVKRASDEMTNVFSVSSENDFVFNEITANSGNFKLMYELDQMFEKLQKLNANLKKSILETHSS